tara:strand:+ start:440 stop:1129 length:690 start_codon:yes stop_codon:yes gene_type:complete
MLQLKNKKKIYFYLFSLIILTTIFNKNFFKEINKIFSIKKIEIMTNKEYLNKKILSKIDYIKNENIFLFQDEDVIKKLIELKLFDSFSIKKKLPSTIIINGKQTDIIAITFINQKKYFVGANGNFIKFKEIQNNKKLPTIFGDFKIKNFIYLKRELLANNINLNKINKYFFHKNKRWDLFFENNILIKLPDINIRKSLKIYNEFINNKNIQPNSIIDLRISNRLIITNE